MKKEGAYVGRCGFPEGRSRPYQCASSLGVVTEAKYRHIYIYLYITNMPHLELVGYIYRFLTLNPKPLNPRPCRV